MNTYHLKAFASAVLSSLILVGSVSAQQRRAPSRTPDEIQQRYGVQGDL
jgi:hypothetical protein